MNSKSKILIVDDDPEYTKSLYSILQRDFSVITAVSFGEAKELLLSSPDLALIDIRLHDGDMNNKEGIDILRFIKREMPTIPVVMMTAFASIPTAVEAMRKGAFDYIQKPFDADAITLLLERALEHRKLVNENEAYRTNARDWQRGRELIGNSPAMKNVMQKIKLLAQTSATVLIRGESGTGKELIARAIHAQSPQSDKPLLCVNCAALSNTLLESELFGHEKGAFTGADRIRKGRFELAEGGTLLLDEISEMDLKLQSKLLRVLQEREFERVGSSVTRQVNVRVLATTNRDLEDWVNQGKFREDLFYRLNVVPIELPPLRQRVQYDIESLCEYFLRRVADREGCKLRILSKDSIELLKKYQWPGNIRELENLMERVAILGISEIITPDMIRGWIELETDNGNDAFCAEQFESKTLADMEREMIEKTLEKHEGHRQKTAQSLGIGIRTLGMKLKRWKNEEAAV